MKKQQYKKRSLRTKLAFNITIINILLGIIAAFLIFSITYKYLSTHLIKDQEIRTSAKVKDLETMFIIAENLSETASTSIILENYLNELSNKSLETDVLKRLNSFNINDSFSAIYLIDKQGNTLVSTEESFVGENYQFRDYFQKALEGEPYVDMAVGITSKALGCYFSYPITIDDSIEAVIVFKLKPERMSALITNNLENEEITYLVNADGIVLLSSNEENVYNSLQELSEEEKEKLEEERKFENIEISSLEYDEIDIKLSNLETIQSRIFIHPETNERKVFTIVPIWNSPFYFISEINTEQLISESIQNAGLMSFTIFSTTLITIILLNYSIKRFLSPLEKVKVFAEEISKGNFDYSIEIKTGDELEELAIKLKEMSINLKDSYEKLKDNLEQAEILTKVAVGRELKMKKLKSEVTELKNQIKMIKEN